MRDDRLPPQIGFDFFGYDGRGYCTGDRVQVHPDTPRYGGEMGIVVGSSATPADRVKVRLYNRLHILFAGHEDTFRFAGRVV